jgi:hypothetical protein
MSYESFRNKETWLLNVWGYIDEIANVWQETEGTNDARIIDITPQYCQDVFDMLIESTYEIIPNGVLKDFIDHSLQSIDWNEVLTHVKDTITES